VDSNRVRKLRRVAELYVRDIEAVGLEQRADGHSRRVRVYNCWLNISSISVSWLGDALYLCSSNM
jgi:hypothetical protein